MRCEVLRAPSAASSDLTSAANSDPTVISATEICVRYERKSVGQLLNMSSNIGVSSESNSAAPADNSVSSEEVPCEIRCEI